MQNNPLVSELNAILRGNGNQMTLVERFKERWGPQGHILLINHVLEEYRSFVADSISLDLLLRHKELIDILAIFAGPEVSEEVLLNYSAALKRTREYFDQKSEVRPEISNLLITISNVIFCCQKAGSFCVK